MTKHQGRHERVVESCASAGRHWAAALSRTVQKSQPEHAPMRQCATAACSLHQPPHPGGGADGAGGEEASAAIACAMTAEEEEEEVVGKVWVGRRLS